MSQQVRNNDKIIQSLPGIWGWRGVQNSKLINSVKIFAMYAMPTYPQGEGFAISIPVYDFCDMNVSIQKCQSFDHACFAHPSFKDEVETGIGAPATTTGKHFLLPSRAGRQEKTGKMQWCSRHHHHHHHYHDHFAITTITTITIVIKLCSSTSCWHLLGWGAEKTRCGWSRVNCNLCLIS